MTHAVHLITLYEYVSSVTDDSNVFSTNYKRKASHYVPSFTTQETKANPLQEFYNIPEQHQNSATVMQEQTEKHFDHFSCPQHELRNTETTKNNLTNGAHSLHNFEEMSLVDLISNGNFAPGPYGNILDLETDAQQQRIEQLYKINCSQDSFWQPSQGFVPTQEITDFEDSMITDNAHDMIEDQFGKIYGFILISKLYGHISMKGLHATPTKKICYCFQRTK